MIFHGFRFIRSTIICHFHEIFVEIFPRKDEEKIELMFVIFHVNNFVLCSCFRHFKSNHSIYDERWKSYIKRFPPDNVINIRTNLSSAHSPVTKKHFNWFIKDGKTFSDDSEAWRCQTVNIKLMLFVTWNTKWFSFSTFPLHTMPVWKGERVWNAIDFIIHVLEDYSFPAVYVYVFFLLDPCYWNFPEHWNAGKRHKTVRDFPAVNFSNFHSFNLQQWKRENAFPQSSRKLNKTLVEM